MGRYIDADALIKEIKEQADDCGDVIEFKLAGYACINVIKDFPAADVREVTLCKNCKNASSYWIEGMIFCEDMECPNVEDGFCNHAERI